MKQTLMTTVVLLAAASAARAQCVKDFVEVDGARANKIRGYGIVTGLGGNGDSPRGESARMLQSMLQNLLPAGVAAAEVNSRNAALVMIAAELPPFQKKGTRFDVSVSVLGDAKSLHGGELQITDLRGPLGRQDPHIYALASGRLVVQGDPKRGNHTTGDVPGGAIVERELIHTFVHERAGGGKVLRLVLKKPDLTTASQLTLQINTAALAGPGGRRDVAVAVDGGLLEVRVPSSAEYQAVAGTAPPVDYEREPVRWLEVILNKPVSFFSVETASVVINDATKTVSWTGEVRLRGGSVALPSSAPGARLSVFHSRDGQRLSEFMEKNGPALGEQQLVDVVKALHGAGLIKAEVRSN